MSIYKELIQPAQEGIFNFGKKPPLQNYTDEERKAIDEYLNNVKSHFANLQNIAITESKSSKYSLIKDFFVFEKFNRIDDRVAPMMSKKENIIKQGMRTFIDIVGFYWEDLYGIDNEGNESGPDRDQANRMKNAVDLYAQNVCKKCNEYIKKSKLCGTITHEEYGENEYIRWNIKWNDIKLLIAPSSAQEGSFIGMLKEGKERREMIRNYEKKMKQDKKDRKFAEKQEAKKQAMSPEEKAKLDNAEAQAIKKADELYTPHLKAISNILEKIAKQPEHKLAARGTEISKISSIADSIDDYDGKVSITQTKRGYSITYNYATMDLWDIYPDARTRSYDDNIPEAEALYDAMQKAVREYVKSKNLPFTVDEGGDWDSWYPEVVFEV